jgi:hypothetical protein
LIALIVCHHSRKERVILKLDFKKKFENFEHQAILKLMEARGFGNVWLSCYKSILSSRTSKVILNSVLGKTVHCKRGVTQGGPLSPLLFVLVVDFLQSLLNKVIANGLLKFPIPLNSTSDFPIIQ